jgi:hypothetical protein
MLASKGITREKEEEEEEEVNELKIKKSKCTMLIIIFFLIRFVASEEMGRQEEGKPGLVG